ncbi:MAG TPA: hypothetical protein VGN07_06090 [Steroidobacteraceae bacterium]
MPLFKRAPKPPAYVPKTGAIVMDRGQFSVVMRTRPVFRDYTRYVGLAAAAIALDNAFTENLRCIGPTGFWTYGSTANFGNPQALKFADDAGLQMFMQVIEGLFAFDIDRMDKRGVYTNGLKGKAGAGLLLTSLRANTEPEANYYQAPVSVPKPGAPVIPPRSPDQVIQLKGLAWLKHGVHGDTSAFTRMLLRNAKFDGSFPLGANSTLLLQAWQALVPLAPAYRGWNNSAGMQKYPSNIGGMKVLNDILVDLSTAAMPPRGDDAWYGLALYMLGSVITTQAFTDGNKRMSRYAYVLMLMSGGVPMVVPNATLGATLGDM